MQEKLIINSEQEMYSFAERIARIAQIGDWVSLIGNLGVGKTIFAKAFIAEMGFDGEVSSPSYALVHSYDPPDTRISVVHADLYRIENESEYLELGLDDATDYGIILLEWADKYPMRFPNNHYKIEIQKISDNIRDITLNIYGESVSRWT